MAVVNNMGEVGVLILLFEGAVEGKVMWRWRDDTIPRESPTAKASPSLLYTPAATYNLPRPAHIPGQGEGRMTLPSVFALYRT